MLLVIDWKRIKTVKLLCFRFRNGNVSCIEALIQASNHETNDDDVDGRTPLLMACLNGHHQAVQVLLALGGDVTKR